MKKTWLTWSAVIALGATAGYLYWYYVGCNSSSCAITSSPVNSTLYGALLGGLLMNTFRRSRSAQSKSSPKS